MNDALIDGLYGNPPSLVTVPQGAVQLSPLMVGAAALEEQPASSLQTMTMLAPAGTLERRYSFALALRALVPDGVFTALALKEKGGGASRPSWKRSVARWRRNRVAIIAFAPRAALPC